MKKFITSLSFIFAFTLLIPILTIITEFEQFGCLYAQTKNTCPEDLEKAEEEYQAGKFDEAIKLIKQCLKEDNVSELEKARAYRLLGLVYIAKELEQQANEAVKNLLIMVPNYKVDPVNDPPTFKNKIETIAKTLNPEISSITPNTVDQGEKNVTLTVKGSNFVNGAVVRFNKEDKQTIFTSETELKAEIPASDLLKEGSYEVNVYSPIASGKISNTQKFIVNPTSSGFPWTWIAVGGGAVAGVIAAIVLLGGKDTPETESIADPPVRP